MYQTIMHPLKVISNYMIFAKSSCNFFIVQMVSHTNRCCSGSSDPIPLNYGNLSALYTPAMLLGVGTLLGDTT
jgi:hypothetical protein